MCQVDPSTRACLPAVVPLKSGGSNVFTAAEPFPAAAPSCLSPVYHWNDFHDLVTISTSLALCDGTPSLKPQPPPHSPHPNPQPALCITFWTLSPFDTQSFFNVQYYQAVNVMVKGCSNWRKSMTRFFLCVIIIFKKVKWFRSLTHTRVISHCLEHGTKNNFHSTLFEFPISYRYLVKIKYHLRHENSVFIYQEISWIYIQMHMYKQKQK